MKAFVVAAEDRPGELARLGQALGEAGVVAKSLDEAQLLQVRGVIEAIGSLGPCCRPQEAELLVVADRARGEAGLLGHLLDAKQALGRAGLGSGQGCRHALRISDIAVYVKVMVAGAEADALIGDTESGALT